MTPLEFLLAYLIGIVTNVHAGSMTAGQLADIERSIRSSAGGRAAPMARVFDELAHRRQALEHDAILALLKDVRHRLPDSRAEVGFTESDRVWLRPLDVTDSAQREAVVAEAAQRCGGVDVLINNAGVAYRAMAVYSASKFALEGASEAMWYELRPWGVHVSLVQPGFINSDSFENTRYTEHSREAADDVLQPYHAHYENMAGFIARIMKLTWATPERVARTVLRTMQHPRPPLRTPATIDARLVDLLRRFPPRRWYHGLLYRALPKVKRWGSGPR